MARRTPRPTAQFSTTLTPLRETCEACGTRWWVASHRRRKIMTLEGLWQLIVIIGQCPNPTCPLYHVRYHPEEEGRWALPHGEIGLDVIAAIGAWRFREHRSVPEMHQRLQARGLSISERAVTHLLHRYEELVTLRVTDQERLQAKLQQQGRVILAIDGLQPDVGHEVHRARPRVPFHRDLACPSAASQYPGRSDRLAHRSQTPAGPAGGAGQRRDL